MINKFDEQKAFDYENGFILLPNHTEWETL